MYKLGISDYNEGLKRVFEEWSSRYKGSTLSAKLSAIKTIAKARHIPIDNLSIEYVQSCIIHIKKADPSNTITTAVSTLRLLMGTLLDCVVFLRWSRILPLRQSQMK